MVHLTFPAFCTAHFFLFWMCLCHQIQKARCPFWCPLTGLRAAQRLWLDLLHKGFNISVWDFFFVVLYLLNIYWQHFTQLLPEHVDMNLNYRWMWWGSDYFCLGSLAFYLQFLSALSKLQHLHNQYNSFWVCAECAQLKSVCLSTSLAIKSHSSYFNGWLVVKALNTNREFLI